MRSGPIRDGDPSSPPAGVRRLGTPPLFCGRDRACAPVPDPMTTRTLAPLGALLLLFSPLTGCDSDGTSSEPAMLRLDVEAMAGDDAFAPGEAFAVNGTTGHLDRARLIVSGITLLHEDGREIAILAETPITVRAQDENEAEIQHTVTEQYVFANAAAGLNPVSLGEVPSGRYTGLRFLLGVDGLDNRIAPGDAPDDHPLAPKDPSMHWNWNAGYVFLRFDGLLDIDGDGTVDPSTGTPRDAASGQWRMHVGGGTNAQTVTLNQPFELSGGAMEDLQMEVDLAAFVSGLDFSDASDRWCMTGGCQDVVDTVKGNASSAFTVLGVQ